MSTLAEQVQADMDFLDSQGWDTDDLQESIEAVENEALLNRIIEEGGPKVPHTYGELNWLAKLLGLPLDPTTGGNNGQL